MAYVGIALHLSGRSSRSDSNNWIRKAMASDDAEFLVNLGEELVIGTAVFRDLEAARDCFDRALGLSELMGAYAKARFAASKSRELSIEYLRRASALGHVPSHQVLNLLLLPKKGFVRRLIALKHLPNLFSEVQLLMGGDIDRSRWWRYEDVLVGGDAELKAILGEDRKRHFPWARPSRIGTFAAVCARGKSSDLLRGAIDGEGLAGAQADHQYHPGR